ncbi:MAG: ester cyclase [Herpetosiphon sp.]
MNGEQPLHQRDDAPAASQVTKAVNDMSRHPDISTMMAEAGSGHRHSMRGFDADYVDIVDYIVRCTHKIWEEHGVGLIYTHYSHNPLVHTAYGITYGREEMITSTINYLAAFPDRKAYADDVIWTGNDVDGFHTSHRVTSIGHHTGYGSFAPPTGRRIFRRGIANCLVKENLIVEEWLVQDNMAVVRQMGLDPLAVVDAMIAEDQRNGVQPMYSYSVGHPERSNGQAEPERVPIATGDGFDIESFVRGHLHEIWNWRLFNKIAEYYVPNYLCYTVPNRIIYGIGDFRAYVMAFIVAFPNAKFNIDHLYWLGDAERGFRVATRWSLIGTHDGPSVYGKPTGKPVHIMGISHHLVQHGKFVEEWTILDELALLKQIRH